MMIGNHRPHKRFIAGSRSQDTALGGNAALQAAKGNPFSNLEHRRSAERCIVTAVNTDKYTCTVYTEHGALIDGIAFPDGGDTIPLMESTEYAVDFSLGEPTLRRVVLEPELSRSDTETQISGVIKGIGGESATQRNTGRGKRRGKRPADVLPGDWVKTGSTGQLLGVLEGGVVLAKASELAQLIMSQANNLVRLIGKSIVVDTGMGTLSMVTSEGKSTLDLKLGGDEATEGSPDAENFRIRAELGAAGELVDFRVTDGAGRALYKMHIDPDGRVQAQCLRRTDQLEEDLALLVGTDAQVDIGRDASLTVGGSVNMASGGNVEVASSGSATLSAAQDVSISSAGALQASSARGTDIVTSGGNTQPAFKVSAVNGNVEFDIGSPLAGDIGLGASAFKVSTTTGDISFRSLVGAFAVNTSRPGGCKLGGTGPGIFGAVVYEQLVSLLAQIAVYLDTHTHTVPAAGGTPTTPPVLPSSAIILPALPSLRSTYVTFGG